MPPGERKSGMPDSVEMPAPVKATMRLAEPIASFRRSMSSMSPPRTLSGCRHAGIVRCAADHGAPLAPDLDGVGEQRARLRIDAAPLVDQDHRLGSLGRRVDDRAILPLGTAMGYALSRWPSQQADDQVARRHFEPPRRFAARGNPFAMVEALAAAGSFD